MAYPILSFKNITKIYYSNSQPIYALNDVSFDIHEGEIFGLLGVNGAGKTTLSSILATLHPPTSGTVLFRGQSIYDNLYMYRHALGFCPQTQNLDTFLNVEQNLIFAGRYFLMPEDRIKIRVKELLEQLELTRYATFDIDQLSGGTKQRVLIARALIHSPQIVILDEPTVGLDPDIRKKLWQIILDLKKQGITIILTTHYLDEAEALSDRVCILHKGKIALIESVSTLKERHQMKRLEDIFLELVEEQKEL
jgi:ABC-2 type transport system ATP-binding protein